MEPSRTACAWGSGMWRPPLPGPASAPREPAARQAMAGWPLLTEAASSQTPRCPWTHLTSCPFPTPLGPALLSTPDSQRRSVQLPGIPSPTGFPGLSGSQSPRLLVSTCPPHPHRSGRHSRPNSCGHPPCPQAPSADGGPCRAEAAAPPKQGASAPSGRAPSSTSSATWHNPRHTAPGPKA